MLDEYLGYFSQFPGNPVTDVMFYSFVQMRKLRYRKPKELETR